MVSALSLGGGGIGQVWGPTTHDEAVATVLEAVEAGISLLDVAPGYGDGEAERVVGDAFGGQLPDGVRISTKCRLGAPAPHQVSMLLERSLAESLARLQLQHIDLFLLHNQLVPDTNDGQVAGAPRTLFVWTVVPAFERFMADGRIAGWGITGIGVPDAVIETVGDDHPPFAVQCVTNLLDSPGSMKRFNGPARPRDIIAAANRCGVPVMGIRAVQAGALTDGFDRELPEDHPDMADYLRARPFRELAREAGESAASLAHRYALSMSGIATVVLGVKNRTELRECIAAEAKGPLPPDFIARIDSLMRPAGQSTR